MQNTLSVEILVHQNRNHVVSVVVVLLLAVVAVVAVVVQIVLVALSRRAQHRTRPEHVGIMCRLRTRAVICLTWSILVCNIHLVICFVFQANSSRLENGTRNDSQHLGIRCSAKSTLALWSTMLRRSTCEYVAAFACCFERQC